MPSRSASSPAITEELDATRYDSESSVLEILSEVPVATPEASAPGLWVQRFVARDGGGEAAAREAGDRDARMPRGKA